MIKPEDIPDDAAEPVARAIYEATSALTLDDEGYEDDGWAYHMQDAREAIAAALNAWGGMMFYPSSTGNEHAEAEEGCVFLPLPQKGAE